MAMMRNILSIYALVFFLGVVSGLEDPWDVAILKAKKFVSNLTIQEKIGLAAGVGWGSGACVGNTPAIDRVNFPGYCLEDSPTGVRFTDHASAFPAGINAAMTWDRDLIYRRGVAMGEEYRGKGVNVALGPMMNMMRAPAAGRNWEGFGADPYLTGEAAAETIKGIQSQGVMTTAKHYVGNEQEHYRGQESSNIDDRTLHELYAYPFLKSVQAGVASIMCSYNQLNGTYACGNHRSLTEILKGQFGFRGFVMSDWWAAQTTAPSVIAGLDMYMPGDSSFAVDLLQAVKNGSLSGDRVDDMAVRIMTPWFLMGQDSGYPPTNLNAFNPEKSTKVNVAGDHYKIIREIGAASTVLLKNLNGILPFPNEIVGSGITTFGLIGSDCALAENGPNDLANCGDSHGCDEGTLAQGWGSGTTNFPYLISPMAAIQERASNNGQTVAWALNDWDLVAAGDLARSSDIAIVFSNADSGEQYITLDGNAGDRNNLSLWHNGDNLIQAVADANPNTVVVIHSVGPVLMPWINHQNIRAVVWAGLPGQESGNALADVLFGDVNPSGKLVFTIAQSRSMYPADVLYTSNAPHPQIDYKEGLLIDYRWFDAKKLSPVFEFGFGLSYTTFGYGTEMTIDPIGVYNGALNQTLFNISFMLSNTGSYQGHEVPQLYITLPDDSMRQLKGFDRVALEVNETKQVTFTLTTLDLSQWNVSSQQWEVLHGLYSAVIGASSRDLLLQQEFSIKFSE